MFDQVTEKGSYRLLGCGLSDLSDAKDADKLGDLLDPDAARRSDAERATDAIRNKFGAGAIVKGRTLR
jgi:DNA polymerase-4